DYTDHKTKDPDISGIPLVNTLSKSSRIIDFKDSKDEELIVGLITKRSLDELNDEQNDKIIEDLKKDNSAVLSQGEDLRLNIHSLEERGTE
ncbi:MAG: hypothetical protein ACK559_20300, partial [bacterium]